MSTLGELSFVLRVGWMTENNLRLSLNDKKFGSKLGFSGLKPCSSCRTLGSLEDRRQPSRVLSGDRQSREHVRESRSLLASPGTPSSNRRYHHLNGYLSKLCRVLTLLLKIPRVYIVSLLVRPAACVGVSLLVRSDIADPDFHDVAAYGLC